MFSEDVKIFFSKNLFVWATFSAGQAVNGLVLASLTEEDLENMGVTKLLGCKVDLELGIEGLMCI